MLSAKEIQHTADQIMQHVSSPARVVVFGSYGRGDATQDSDLDLLVIQKSVADFTQEYTRLREAIGAIGVGVDLHGSLVIRIKREVEGVGGAPGALISKGTETKG